MSSKTLSAKKTVADFFAGIGLVSMGLKKAGWDTIYALDYEQEKADAYHKNFGEGHYHVQDIANAKGSDVPNVTLAHASFPCTDLSVAGARGGIHKGESSAFWHFARILKEMKQKKGSGNPPLVLLENVEGLLTSNNGKDLRAVLSSLNDLGYRVDLIRVDASHFVPQSRVRIFIVGVHEKLLSKINFNSIEQEYAMRNSNARPKKIVDYISKNSDLKWYFHQLPNLPERKISLEEIIDPTAEWWADERMKYLFSQMHKRHQELLKSKKKDKGYNYYPAFRRMRIRDGKSQSTVELRTDGIAGCLRTPKGGSARQIMIRAGKGSINARLINEIEAARLMGANNFKFDPSWSLNQVLFGFGDAVCVSALEWIGKNYFNTLEFSR